MKFNWQDLAAIAAVWTVLTGIIIFVFRPFLDKIWIATFKRSKSDIKAVLNGWYNVAEQGVTYTKLRNDQEKLVEETKRQTQTLDHIEQTIGDLSRSIANLYGILGKDGWDGKTDRRRH